MNFLKLNLITLGSLSLVCFGIYCLFYQDSNLINPIANEDIKICFLLYFKVNYHLDILLTF